MAAITSSLGKSGWMPLSSSKGPESLRFQVDGAGPGAVIAARGEGGKRAWASSSSLGHTGPVMDIIVIGLVLQSYGRDK